MERQDLNSILIKDSEFYNPGATYVGLINKKNITTVGQLLNECTEENFNLFVKGYSGKTIHQLRGFISVLENQYIGKPLLYDALLDEKINFDESNMGVITLITDDDSYSSIRLDTLFGCPRERVKPVWEEFKRIVMHPMIHQDFDLPKDNVKVIDFIKWVMPIDKAKFKHIIPFAKIYIDAYEKQRQLGDNDLEKIEELKGQLVSILETRERLDKQIVDLQGKINSLSNSENKGDIKR